MRRIKLFVLLACLTFAAVPVMAQPASLANDSLLQGDITVLNEGTLEKSITDALSTSNDQLGVELETALGNVITEATDQLESGETVGGLLQSPAFQIVVMALLNAILVFFTVNGFKLSTMWLKGRKTLTLAALLSALTSGAGVFFGPAAVLPMPERVAFSLAAALGTLTTARGFQETKRQIETKKRRPERKAAKKALGTIDLVLDGLLKQAAKLPMPYNLAASLVTNLYHKYGREYVEDLIGQQRALSEAELSEAGDEWEKAHLIGTAPEQPRLRTTPAVTPAPEG